MGVFRIPISGIMAFIVALGVAFAALRGATELWSSGMFTLALLVAGLALLGARFASGRARVAWAGYLAFEAGYLLLAAGPWFADRVEPHLLTTRAIDARYARMWHIPEADGEVAWVSIAGSDSFERGHTFDVGKAAGGMFPVSLDRGTIDRYPPSEIRGIGPESHRRLCHSVIALLVGFPGALIALAFSQRGRGGSNPAPS